MADLERELRALGESLLVPPGAALPGTVRARVTAMPAPDRAGWWRRGPAGWSPVQRATLLAATFIVAVASVAGAATLGLPGLRIVFGPVETPIASAVPSVAGSPLETAVPGLGIELGLGEAIALDAVHASVPFAVVVPTDPRLGDLEVVRWDARLGDGQVALLWAATSRLPAIDGTDVGAILTETPGRTDEGYIRKVLGPGTTAEPVAVGDASGFWISGEPHEFLYVTPDGVVVADTRRAVGDTLTWWRDGILYRLESGLGRDAAIEVAESMP